MAKPADEPFASLNKSVIVSSNAGAYSDEVAEYAWALLLSAAKRIVELHVSLREQKWTLKRTLDEGSEITVLRKKILGILGLRAPSCQPKFPICDRRMVVQGKSRIPQDGLSLSLTAEFHRDPACLGAIGPRYRSARQARSGEHYPISETAPPSQHSGPRGIQDKLPILATGPNERLREQSV